MYLVEANAPNLTVKEIIWSINFWYFVERTSKGTHDVTLKELGNSWIDLPDTYAYFQTTFFL